MHKTAAATLVLYKENRLKDSYAPGAAVNASDDQASKNESHAVLDEEREVPPVEPGRLDAFISYSRAGGGAKFVDRLTTELERRNKAVWIDRKKIEPAAEWRARIAKGIEAARAFIFVLSPESVASLECRKELDAAIEAHKQIIPVVFKEVARASLPDALTAPNWIYFREEDDGPEAVDEVVEALDSDVGWRDLHTRLGVRANEWLSSNRDSSFLLRGIDLRQAEDWYAEEALHKERPTPAQAYYISASRKAAAKRQRQLITGVTFALVVSLVLSAVALIKTHQVTVEAQHLTTEVNRTESIIEANEAEGLLTTNTPLAMLVAIEARAKANTPQALDALAAAASTPWQSVTNQGSLVPSVAFSPNGKLLASGNDKGQVLIYNRRTGRTTTLNNGTGKVVTSVAFSPDGETLASGGVGKVALYNLLSRRIISFNIGGLVYNIAFSPSGKLLAIGDIYGRVMLYNLVTGHMTTLTNTDRRLIVYSVAFSPNGKILASGDNAGNVVLYNLETGHTTTLSDKDKAAVHSVTFSPDGRLLASGDDAGRVALYNLATGRSTVRGNTDGISVNSVAFSQDGKVLASGDGRGRVVIDQLTTSQTTTLNDGGIPVYSVAFSPDGATLASGDGSGEESIDGMNLARSAGNGRVVFYDLTSSFNSTLDDGSAVESLAFSPNGKTLASGDGGGKVVLRERSTGQAITLTDPACQNPPICNTRYGSAVYSVAFSPYSKMLASGDVNGALILHDFSNGRSETLYDSSGASINCIAFSPKDKILAYGTSDGRVVLYNLATQQKAPLGETNGPSVNSVAFSANGKILASGNDNGQVMLYEVGTGQTTRLQVSNAVRSVAFSANAKVLAEGTSDGRVMLYHLITGQTTTLSSSSGAGVNSIAFQPGGKIIATGDDSGRIVLYNLGTGQTTTLNESSAVHSVAFSPDGKILASGNDNGQVLSINSLVGTSGVVSTLCRELGGQNMTHSQWKQYIIDQPYRATCR
jgi:WD40 repeat protein